MILRNSPCWCGSEKKWKKCHYPIQKPEGVEDLRIKYEKQFHILLKNEEQVEGIRRACQLAANILRDTCLRATAGVTTEELSDFALELHQKGGAKPAPLGYGSPPFPKPICTSLNEVICHGIPNSTALREGDILNIDVTPILDGFYGDCSAMVAIGTISPEKQKVIDVSHASLMKSIEILKPGMFLSEIGKVISNYATSQHTSVVTEFVGHGVGLSFHEPPQVLHYYNEIHIPLAPGMIFTIEPMINAGVKEAVIDSKDQWTARTADGKPSAQWEHTILITQEGHEILTKLPE